jgi:hypothetical protein
MSAADRAYQSALCFLEFVKFCLAMSFRPSSLGGISESSLHTLRWTRGPATQYFVEADGNSGSGRHPGASRRSREVLEGIVDRDIQGTKLPPDYR